MDNPVRKKSKKKVTTPVRKRAPAHSEEAIDNRSIWELRNKLRRTVYAIVDYHMLTTHLRLSPELMEMLARDTLKSLYAAAGYDISGAE